MTDYIRVGDISISPEPDERTFNDDIRGILFPGADEVGRQFGVQIGRAIEAAVHSAVADIRADAERGVTVGSATDTDSACADIDFMRLRMEADTHKVHISSSESDNHGLVSTILGALRGGQSGAAAAAGDEEAAGGLLGAFQEGGVSGLLQEIGTNLLSGAGVGLGVGVAASTGLSVISVLGGAAVGLGAAAIVIVPEITAVTSAIDKVGAARRAAIARLSPAERGLVGPLERIKADFQQVQKELAPAVAEIVKLAAGTIRSLVPEITAFAATGISVVRNFLVPLDAWVRTKAFQQMSDKFAQYGELAGAILGPQIVKVVQFISRLFLSTLPTGIYVLGQLLPNVTGFIEDLTPGIIVEAKIGAAVLTWIRANHLLIEAFALTLAIIAGMGIYAVIAGTASTLGLGAIIALAVLTVLVIGELATHWQQIWAAIRNAAADAWNFLTHGWAQILIPGLTAIRIMIELVRDHWRGAWTAIRNWAQAVWNFLIHGLGQLLVPQIKQIATVVDAFRGGWRQGWNDIRGLLLAVWHVIQDVIHTMLRAIADIPDAFRTAVGAVGRTWDTVRSIFLGPVKFLVDTVYDNGIARLWNDVMNKIGGPTLPIVPKLSTGGLIPADSLGSVAHPALPLFHAMGARRFQAGGVAGGDQTAPAATGTVGIGLTWPSLGLAMPGGASDAMADTVAWAGLTLGHATARAVAGQLTAARSAMGGDVPGLASAVAAVILAPAIAAFAQAGAGKAAGISLTLPMASYDAGGWFPNNTIGVNTSGHAEYVLTHEDLAHAGTERHIHRHFGAVPGHAFEPTVRQAFQVMEMSDLQSRN